MKTAVNGAQDRETSLVKFYMDLTGASESAARGVFIHVCGSDVNNRRYRESEGVPIPVTADRAIIIPENRTNYGTVAIAGLESQTCLASH
jgi:hypothetical protein